MPSRRSVLATVSVASVGAFGGCSILSPGNEGYVQLKSIQATATVDGTSHTESIVRVGLSSPPGEEEPELSRLDDRWVDRFETPRTPEVSESLARDFDREFDDVRYVVGVCCPAWADPEEDVGCFNVATTRETFNRAQVHDRVRASSDGTTLTIHSVDGEWNFESV